MAREQYLIEEMSQGERPQFEVVQSTHADVVVDVFVEVVRDIFKNHPLYTYVPRKGSSGPDFEQTSIVIVDKYTEDALFLPAITFTLGSINTTWINFSHSPFMTALKFQYDGYGNILRDEKGKPVASHYEYVGAYEGSITFNISAGSTIEREELSNYIHVMQAEILRDHLYMRGIFIKNVTTNGFAEVEYRNNYLYQTTITVEFYSEWKRKVPVGETLKSIGYEMTIDKPLVKIQPTPAPSDPLEIFNLENEYYVIDDLTGKPVIPDLVLSPSEIQAPIALVFNATTSRWEVSDFWKKVLESTEVDFEEFEKQLTATSAANGYVEHAARALVQANLIRALSITQGKDLPDGSKVVQGAIIYPDQSVDLKGGKFNEPVIMSTRVEANNDVTITRMDARANKLVFVVKDIEVDAHGVPTSGLLYKRVVDRNNFISDKLVTKQSKTYLDGENLSAITAEDLFLIVAFCKQPFRYSVSSIVDKLDQLLVELADQENQVIYRTQKIQSASKIKRDLLASSEEFLLDKPASLF